MPFRLHLKSTGQWLVVCKSQLSSYMIVRAIMRTCAHARKLAGILVNSCFEKRGTVGHSPGASFCVCAMSSRVFIARPPSHTDLEAFQADLLLPEATQGAFLQNLKAKCRYNNMAMCVQVVQL